MPHRPNTRARAVPLDGGFHGIIRVQNIWRKTRWCATAAEAIELAEDLGRDTHDAFDFDPHHLQRAALATTDRPFIIDWTRAKAAVRSHRALYCR